MEKNWQWSWADKISTYRFWGIVLFYLCSISSFFIFSVTYLRWFESMGLQIDTIAVFFSTFQLLGVVGLFIGWIVVKFAKIKPGLLVFAVVQIVGICVLILFDNPGLRIIGAGLWGLGYSPIFVIMPSALAGGKSSMSTFAGLYFVVLFYERLQNIALGAEIGYLHFLDTISPVAYTVFMGFPVLVAIGFLLPVKSVLFEEQPKERLKPLDLKHHSVLARFLLCIIPFYSVYFMYKIHGQAANFSRTSKLLSKKGALWISLLFPVTLPVITTTLYDVLQEYAKEKNVQTHKKGLILIFTVLFFPVTAALVQSDMNKLIKVSS